MHMRGLIVLPFFFLLLSCIPVERQYYLPSNGEDAFEGQSCGAVPYGGYSKEVAAGVRLVVSATIDEDDLWIHFQFIVEEGHTLKFESKRIGISTGIGTFRYELINSDDSYGYASIDPTEAMKGGKNQLYVANLKVPDFNHDTFTLIMPSAEVDFQPYKVNPISFFLVRRKGVMTCIQ